MGAHAIYHVLKQSQAKRVERFVLIAMADMASQDGVAFPKVRSLMEYTGYSERKVREALAWLRERGEIEVIEVGGAGARKWLPTVYRINSALPGFKPADPAPTPPAGSAPTPLQVVHPAPADPAGSESSTHEPSKRTSSRERTPGRARPSNVEPVSDEKAKKVQSVMRFF